MLAVGLALSHHVLGMYYQRLICHKLPPREVIVSSFIPVGAVGMGGWALLNLAAAADTHVRAYHLTLSPSAEDAACWWLVLAVSSVGQTLRQGIPFTLGWWGAVFPIRTFAGTTLALGHTFHSFAFTVAGAAFSCCQVAVWLFVDSRTLYQGWAGDLFHPPCLSPPALLAEHLAAPSAIMRLEKRLSLPSSALPTLASLRRQLDHYPWPDFENDAPLQATSSSWPNGLGREGSRLHRTHADMHGVLSGCLSVPAASLPSRQEASQMQQQGVDCVPSLPRTDSGRGVHGYCSAVPAALLRADTFERQMEQRQRQMDAQARLMGLSHSR
ncbi:hypothetical protein OEZ86_006979 [Tetradesmus obliquus]|nr:hypothetical protein OEZ86_006979 [Tetradesmus obliquus]